MSCYRKVVGSILHFEASLGTILCPKLFLMCRSAPCMAATAISIWKYVWITASCFGQKRLLNALKCKCTLAGLSDWKHNKHAQSGATMSPLSQDLHFASLHDSSGTKAALNPSLRLSSALHSKWLEQKTWHEWIAAPPSVIAQIIDSTVVVVGGHPYNLTHALWNSRGW